MSDVLSRFIKDESGATAIEYGLIAALVSIALITGGQALGNQLGATFTNLKERLANATSK